MGEVNFSPGPVGSSIECMGKIFYRYICYGLHVKKGGDQVTLYCGRVVQPIKLIFNTNLRAQTLNIFTKLKFDIFTTRSVFISTHICGQTERSFHNFLIWTNARSLNLCS